MPKPARKPLLPKWPVLRDKAAFATSFVAFFIVYFFVFAPFAFFRKYVLGRRNLPTFPADAKTYYIMREPLKTDRAWLKRQW